MQLVTALTEPGKLYAELKQKPNFALPFLLMLIIPVAAWMFYFQRVDAGWLIDHILAGADVPPAKLAAARSHMSIGAIKWSAVIVSPIVVALFTLILAVYYMLAAKVAGVQQNFKAWLSFTSWSFVPALLSAIVTLVAALTMVPQTAMDGIQLTHVDQLLLHLSDASPWKKIMSSIDLLNLWVIWLAASGWRAWSGRSWGQSFAVAALPSVLIYGIWALVIFAKH